MMNDEMTWCIWLPIHPEADEGGRILAPPSIVGLPESDACPIGDVDDDMPVMFDNMWGWDPLRTLVGGGSDRVLLEPVALIGPDHDILMDEEGTFRNPAYRNLFASSLARYLGRYYEDIDAPRDLVGNAVVTHHRGGRSMSIAPEGGVPTSNLAWVFVDQAWHALTRRDRSLKCDPIEPPAPFVVWPG